MLDNKQLQSEPVGCVYGDRWRYNYHIEGRVFSHLPKLMLSCVVKIGGEQEAYLRNENDNSMVLPVPIYDLTHAACMP